MGSATAVKETTRTRVRPARDRSTGKGSKEPYRRAAPRPGFVPFLEGRTEAQRLSHYTYGEFNLAEAMIWAALFPDEVPLVNGEFEWIARTLADLD